MLGPDLRVLRNLRGMRRHWSAQYIYVRFRESRNPDALTQALVLCRSQCLCEILPPLARFYPVSRAPGLTRQARALTRQDSTQSREILPSLAGSWAHTPDSTKSRQDSTQSRQDSTQSREILPEILPSVTRFYPVRRDSSKSGERVWRESSKNTLLPGKTEITKKQSGENRLSLANGTPFTG